MTQTFDTFLDRLERTNQQSGISLLPPSSPVRSPDQTAGTFPPPDVDRLFGESIAYREFKREKPEHRLMLWLRLQGHSIKETATLTGYTANAVREVCHQPWFSEAFCRLSTEIGKDVVETFLEGEVVNTLQVLVKLRDSAESDAVKKSACDSILDRIRGKPTVRIESKVSGSLDTTVYDAAKLLEEQKRLTEDLRSRGIGAN